MKTSNTTTVEIRKKVIEFEINDLFSALATTLLIGITSILLYKSFYLLSIGVILVSYGSLRIYRLYKEFHAIDWSIDVSDFTMEDVIADLENITSKP